MLFYIEYVYITLIKRLGTAANIRVGQFLGANKPNEAKNAAKVSYTLIGKNRICMIYQTI